MSVIETGRKADPCFVFGLCCVQLHADGKLRLSWAAEGICAMLDRPAPGEELARFFEEEDLAGLAAAARAGGEVTCTLRLLPHLSWGQSALTLAGLWDKGTLWAVAAPAAGGILEHFARLQDWYAGFRDLLQSSNQQAYEWDLSTGELKEAGYQSVFWKEIMRSAPVVDIGPDGLPGAENVYEADVHAFRQLHASVLAGGAGGTVELRMRTGFGIYRWCRLNLNTLYDDRGEPLRAVGLITDIEYEKRDQLALLRKASQDGLTGLYNNEAFSDKLDAALARWQDRTTALYLVTVDDYPAVSAALGSTETRALLADLGSSLRRLVGGAALCGRLGADSFALLAPVKGLRTGYKLAQTLCDGLRRTPKAGLQSLTVTVSVGMALAPKEKAERAKLIRQADLALARAMQTGNAALCYSAEMEEGEGAGIRIGGVAAEDGRFDNDLLYTFFDRLYTADDTDTAVRGVLQMAAEHYHADRAFVWLADEEDPNRCQLSLEWHAEKVRSLTAWPAAAELSLLRSPDGERLFCCEDIGALPEAQQRFLRRRNVRSLLQAEVQDAGLCRAVVGFHCCGEGRLWTEEEKNTLTLAAKLLSGFLLRVALPEQAAGQDPLTGLQSTQRFKLKAARRLAEPGSHWQLAILDVRRFRDINALFGTRIGDKLLTRFARLVRSSLREKELACRVSSTGIAVLWQQRGGAEERLRALLDSFAPVSRELIGAHQFALSAGVTEAKGQSVELLLEQAKLACRQAKDKNALCVVFDDTLRRRFELRRAIMAGQQNALKNREFALYIQPKYAAADGALSGAGAWVRWNHPTAGQLVNSQFLPVFRETGFVLDLDYEVIDQICAAIARWPAERRVPVSVRVDRLHFSMDDFVARLCAITEKHGVAPRLLCLEVQEDAFLGENSAQFTCLAELKEKGFTLMLSGFGRGWSSLDVLTRAPFDVLRLDQAFFTQNADDGKHLVADTVCRMARQLGMRVSAEGVDTPEQEAFLRQVQADELQGERFVTTLSGAEFEALLCQKDTRVAPLFG